MYRMYAYFLVVLASLVYECGSFGLVYRTGCCPTPDLVPDIAKQTSDFIEGFGYGVEIHEIVTPDGYILKMHRVLPPFPETFQRPAVILQHGIAGSSVLWVMNQEKSFPFLLTNEDFDTWLLDTRGNSYSNKHVSLRQADSDYWKFSFHEQGTIDLATAVDYVLNVTQNEKVFFVGHSRGTTMALALLSTRPEYNDKFHLLSFFAPVAYVRHVANPFLKAVFNSGILPALEETVKKVGAFQVPGSSVSSIQIREILCNRTQAGCIKIIFSFSGFDYELLNKTMIPIYLSHYPEGGAIQEYLHYIQIADTDEFRQFDYGKRKNMEVYGRSKPPLYDLARITAPIALYHGDNDFFVTPKDRIRLTQQLRSVVADIQIAFKKFTHMDFLWATKADIYVYRPAIEFMKRFVYPRYQHRKSAQDIRHMMAKDFAFNEWHRENQTGDDHREQDKQNRIREAQNAT